MFSAYFGWFIFFFTTVAFVGFFIFFYNKLRESPPPLEVECSIACNKARVIQLKIDWRRWRQRLRLLSKNKKVWNEFASEAQSNSFFGR